MKSRIFSFLVIAVFLLTVGVGTAFSQGTPQSKDKKVEKKEHVMKTAKKEVKHAKVAKKHAQKAVMHARVEKKTAKKSEKK